MKTFELWYDFSSPFSYTHLSVGAQTSTGSEPSLVDAFRAWVDRIEVHVRRTPVADLPADEEGLARWVHDCFREKDRRLARFAVEQRFTGHEWADRVRLLDWFVSESHRARGPERA